MTTVSSTPLLNLLLGMGGNASAESGLPLDMEGLLQLPEGLEAGSLSPEILDALAADLEEGGFAALMQQRLQAEEALPEALPDGGEDAVSLVFTEWTAELPRIAEAPVMGPEEDPARVPMEALEDQVETAETAPDSSLIGVGEFAGQNPIPVATPAVQGVAESVRSVMGERPAVAPGVEDTASVADEQGQVLPPQRQAAAALLAEGEAVATVWPGGRSGESPAAAQQATTEKLPTGEQPGRPSTSTETATASLPKEDGEAPEHEPDFLARLRQGDRDEPAVSREPSARLAPDAARPDAATPRAEGVLLHTGLRAGESEVRGMNELPPELRQMQLSPRAGEAAWGREVGERIGFLLHNNLKQAEIRLDPPHLGKLEIQLQVQDDKAVINIHTQTAQTRDLIDASLLRLREALQDAGYSQVDVNVSQREQSMAGQHEGRSGSGFAGGGSGGTEETPLPPSMTRREIALTARMQGRIDFFA